MRLLFTIIIGVFLFTFIWGLFIHVLDGPWNFERYLRYYVSETKENFQYWGQSAAAKFKPPARKTFDPNAS